MLKESLDQTLKELIVRNSIIKITEDQIGNDSNLVDHFGYDSVSVIKLITDIENVFHIRIADSDLNMSIIGIYGALRDYIAERV